MKTSVTENYYKTTISHLFKIGDVVYFIASDDRSPWMVVGIVAKPGTLIYDLSTEGGMTTTAYEFELTQDKY